MGYSVKWLKDNLGITLKAIRYYEDKGLLPRDSSRNPINNYRDYSDEDVDLIWLIKLLMGIGFTASEIKSFMDNEDANFYDLICGKIEELEQRKEEIEGYIQFAKTIRLMGKAPTVEHVGSIRYDDFIHYSRENWNAYKDKKLAPALEFIDIYLHTDDFQHLEENPQLSGLDENMVSRIEALKDFFSDYEGNQRAARIDAYYRILVELSDTDPRSEAVQRVVGLLYSYVKAPHEEAGDQLTEDFFARYTVPAFTEGSDLYLANLHNYGADGCRFIAEAVAYFGGYENPAL